MSLKHPPLGSLWFIFQDKLERERKEKNESNTESATRGQSHQRLVVPERERNRATLHLVESLALVMMCSCKPVIRKQAVIVLKEVRNIFVALNIPKVNRNSVWCLSIFIVSFEAGIIILDLSIQKMCCWLDFILRCKWEWLWNKRLFHLFN